MKRTLLEAANDVSPKGHAYKINFWAGQVARVDLIDYPIDARRTLARATRGYTGNYTLDPMTKRQLRQNMSDLKNTKLGTPAEMINFVFLIRDVPRSWTHQAVRTRIGAAVVQQSTRFVGAMAEYNILVPKTVHTGTQVNTHYLDGSIAAIWAYEASLEDQGVISQDARNLLPHSVLTHMFWSLNLRALIGIYQVRWCCQAEPSTWMPIMKQMKTQITLKCGKDIADFLEAPFDRGEACGFDASFDRPCTWKSRK